MKPKEIENEILFSSKLVLLIKEFSLSFYAPF